MGTDKKAEVVPEYMNKIDYRLNKYILPYIGHKPIKEITKADISQVIDIIRALGHIETARRVNRVISQVFRFAMTKDLTDKDPTVIYKLPKTITKHMPAILDPEKVGELLRKIESYRGNFVVRNALLLLALTFVRPYDLRTAQWKEINLNEAVWDIPQEKTKTKTPHRVFLSKQALEILIISFYLYFSNFTTEVV